MNEDAEKLARDLREADEALNNLIHKLWNLGFRVHLDICRNPEGPDMVIVGGAEPFDMPGLDRWGERLEWILQRQDEVRRAVAETKEGIGKGVRRAPKRFRP